MATIHIQPVGGDRRMIVLEGSELIRFREDYELYSTSGALHSGTYNGHDLGITEKNAITISFVDVTMIL
jgi:hypothetical protein